MKNIRTLLQQARYKMWEEPTNSVGTGANVALPPAHEPPGIPASKKKKKYDGRTKAGRKLVNRILSNREKRAKKKMVQALDTKNELVTRILSQDLQILSFIEDAKSEIIKELTVLQTSKKALRSYKSGRDKRRVNEKV